MLPDGRRLGAHLPLGTGMVKAVERAHEIGADAIQLFSDNPTAWGRRPRTPRATPTLRQRLYARSFGREPVIVTGDFNVGESNPALATLVGRSAPDASPPLVDTFRVLHPGETTVGTFTAFKFGSVTGDKIDYVLVQPGTEVMSAEIVRFSRNNRYPSDHFPVTARVRLGDR